MRANEIRNIEQTAAWDSMMSKESRREGGKQVEAAFVTSSYLKQLELQDQHKKIVDQKESQDREKSRAGGVGFASFY